MTTLENNNALKALLLIVSGFILLLYTLGIITAGLNLIFILTAVGLMVYGFLKLDAQNRVKSWIQSFKKKH